MGEDWLKWEEEDLGNTMVCVIVHWHQACPGGVLSAIMLSEFEPLYKLP